MISEDWDVRDAGRLEYKRYQKMNQMMPEDEFRWDCPMISDEKLRIYPVNPALNYPDNPAFSSDLFRPSSDLKF
jgi:hypothetical protein